MGYSRIPPVDGTLVQVVSCGWKSQPHLCTNADLWLVPETRGQERELSKAFLDLPRQASEKDLEWQATRDAVLRKNENVEVKDNLLHHGNRWVHPMIQPSSYAFRARITTPR
jgi:hypothetical protein